MGFTVDTGSYGALFPVKAIAGSNVIVVTGQFDFDDKYPTGGESMDISAYFPNKVLGVLFENKGGYVFEYDYNNKKVIAYHGNNDGTSDGPLVEVGNETDLKTITGVRFIAYGV